MTDNNIFLIGMPGSGKTFWGKKIAQFLGKDFFDLDEEIEKDTQETIIQIFQSKGEEFFRKKEREVLNKFENKKNIVLATGGGTPCFLNNMDWLDKQGITIWIKVPPEILAYRLLEETAQRPLFKDIPHSQLLPVLQQQMKDRMTYYSKAQLHVEGTSISLNEFIKKLKDV
ncbi:MAG: shikimate kinase [Bacteroidetes bacterium]|nr:shikimate kinase [Bacteroidota bacterium]